MIEPDFSPGAGWHRVPGYSMPGSTTDLEARAVHAYRCWVLPMRRHGRRLPAESMLHEEPIQGGLLMMESLGDHWDAHLFDPQDFTRPVMFMGWARLVRDRGGCRLYQGLARDDSGLPRIPQTWLCTPSPERTREILASMAEREWR